MENENGKSENKFWGVVVYEIVDDKCLNGLWTNNDPQKGGVLMNEIARKIDKKVEEIICDYERNLDKKVEEIICDYEKNLAKKRKEIIGDYHVSWIEPNQVPIKGKLNITPTTENVKVYSFTWSVDGEAEFKGIGMLLGLKQLVAFYWKDGDTYCI